MYREEEGDKGRWVKGRELRWWQWSKKTSKGLYKIRIYSRTWSWTFVWMVKKKNFFVFTIAWHSCSQDCLLSTVCISLSKVISNYLPDKWFHILFGFRSLSTHSPVSLYHTRCDGQLLVRSLHTPVLVDRKERRETGKRRRGVPDVSWIRSLVLR